MKIKIHVIDFEIPARVKAWGIRLAVLTLSLGTAAIALGAGPLHVWMTGDTLQATDLNGNFSNLQAQLTSSWILNGSNLYNDTANIRVGIGTSAPSVPLDVNGPFIRQIARAHADGPTDATANGLLATRHLAFAKTQVGTGVRVTWQDSRTCYHADANPGSCEWEIKFDGASCADPGPLRYDLHAATDNFGGASGTIVGTCFGISTGGHTIQAYVATPDTGGGDLGVAIPSTGFNDGYWSLEAEEVY